MRGAPESDAHVQWSGNAQLGSIRATDLSPPHSPISTAWICRTEKRYLWNVFLTQRGRVSWGSLARCEIGAIWSTCCSLGENDSKLRTQTMHGALSISRLCFEKILAAFSSDYGSFISCNRTFPRPFSS